MFIPVLSVTHWIGSSCRPSSRPRTLAPQMICTRPSMKNVRPIVAMNSVICGWLTSGRSTTRSVTRPSTTMTASASGIASQKLTGVLLQADERRGGEEHHRALREVEHAGRLVDQHEAERDERIHHARQQAADQDFEEECHVGAISAPRPGTRRSPPCCRGLPRACRRRSSCRSRERPRGRRCPSRRPCRARSARSSCRTAR